MSRTLYCPDVLQTGRRSADLALPSRTVVLDDAIPASYTFTVETSEGKLQAYLLCEDLLSPADNAALCRRLAFVYRGDPAFWPITHLVRVPGAYNTKYPLLFATRLSLRTCRIHSAAELRAMGSQASFTGSHSGAAAVGDDRTDPHDDQLTARILPLDPATVLDLIRTGALRASDYLLPGDYPRRLLNTRRRGYCILWLNDFPLKPDGQPDTSLARWWVAFDLRKCGAPDDEIAFCVWVCCRWPGSRHRDEAAILADIGCILPKLHKTVSVSITPMRYTASTPHALTLPRHTGRPGRPSSASVATLIAWMRTQADAEGWVHASVRATAQALDVSVATVKRLERAARAEGRLSGREVGIDGTSSRVRVQNLLLSPLTLGLST